jgi:uncharacterized protein
MSNPPASREAGPASTQPDTSRLNGLQTSGRSYRNLSAAEHAMQREVDQKVPLRDDGYLLADVYRPEAAGRFPVLIAASPYPRQIQDLVLRQASSRRGTASFSSPGGTST